MELSKERLLEIAKALEFRSKNAEIKCGKCGMTLMQYSKEEVAFYEQVVKLLQTKESGLQQEMKKRNMTEADILEYMKFEDTCVLKGFTLKGLLEAGEKQKAKRPYWALDRQQESAWMNCPCCQQKVTVVNKCCPTCGQKLDWRG